MRLYRAICDDCGYTRDRLSSQAAADYTLRRHSCERQRSLAARRQAVRDREARVDRTPKPCGHGGRHEHGTKVMHTADGCRCRPCSDAATAYYAHIRRQRAYGRWSPRVPAGPAREHLAKLVSAGVGLWRVSQLTGVAYHVLTRIYGDDPREIRRSTADRILALDPADPLEALADRGVVDATGTVRRIRALVAIGYSQCRIADALGWASNNLTDLTHGRTKCAARTAREVRDLYDRWSMHPPQPTEWREKISVSRSRRYAAARGWPPPLAWDDEDIDNPTARPAGLGDDEPLTRSDLYLEMRSIGVPRQVAAERAGLAPTSVPELEARLRGTYRRRAG